MADTRKLGLAKQFPALSAQTGYAPEATSPIDQMLSNTGSMTSNLSPGGNPGVIGADNDKLNSDIQTAVQNIFNLLQGASTKSTENARALAAKRQQEEANAKAIALQAKILEAQKKAALAGLPKGTSSGGGGNTPTPSLPTSPPSVAIPKIPGAKNDSEIKLPLVKPRPKRDPRKPGIQN